MSFISTGGGGKWSQITIDTDKDMGAFGLSNLKQVVAGMIGGDLIAKGLGGVLVRIPAGIATQVLTSNGVGLVPSFQPGSLYLNRYFPEMVSLSVPTLTKNTARTHNQAVSMTGKLPSVYVNSVVDNVANLTKLLTPAVTIPIATAKNTTRTHTQTGSNLTGKLPSHADLGLAVLGAESYLGAVYTDETTAAQNTTANDMHLMAVAPAVGDIYYFAYNVLWDFLTLVLGTKGVGIWGFTWEYWNGAWVALAGITDGTNNFMNVAGTYVVKWTRPGDWATTTVNGVGPYYWIRARLTSYTSKTTIPLGTQAFASVKNAI
jgi:hypothetical protein